MTALRLTTSDSRTMANSAGSPVSTKWRAETFSAIAMWYSNREMYGSSELDHFGPLLGVFGDDITEFGGRHHERVNTPVVPSASARSSVWRLLAFPWRSASRLHAAPTHGRLSPPYFVERRRAVRTEDRLKSSRHAARYLTKPRSAQIPTRRCASRPYDGVQSRHGSAQD